MHFHYYMKLMASGLCHIPSGKIGLQGITIKPSEEILALQAKMIEALAPYRKSGVDQARLCACPNRGAGKPCVICT
jgi:hypothetical protein